MIADFHYFFRPNLKFQIDAGYFKGRGLNICNGGLCVW